ncbi:MAG: transcription termination/antitermination NusG family protein, partial [Pseudomonadota bacterium]
EKFAAKNLQDQGLEVFLPARKKAVRQRRNFRTITAPLFPGYIFVSFEIDVGTVRSVNGTRGVKHLISNGATPSSLPAGFVESLISGLDELGIVSQRPNLSPGDVVEFASGPFANQLGELLDMDDRGRVSVLMTMLSSQIPVKTTISNLLPA